MTSRSASTMTTPQSIPTSSAADPLAAPMPRGLPDAATLAQAATEFFRALPSTPFSPLGEASGQRSLSAPPTVHSLAENRVTPQSFALPGAAELERLLEEFAPASMPTVAPLNTAGRYYFLADPPAPLTAPAVPASARPSFDVYAVRRDFPVLAERVNGRPLIWFDNAATTQKPQAVIDRLAQFYVHENSNIHRAAHELAARATDAYENARSKVARFLGASSPDEIVFVRGATEAINLVAQSWGRQNIGAGDEIVLSLLEHHANIVPWQQLAIEKGARIRVIPVDSSGQILLDEYQKLVTDRTKLVAISQVSNALGTITPVREIVEIAHRNGAVALVDRQDVTRAAAASATRRWVIDFNDFDIRPAYCGTGQRTTTS